MKTKDIPLSEQLNELNINVFESSSDDKPLSPNYTNKSYYRAQIELRLYENHYFLITNLRNFCRKKENYPQLCRRCLNTFENQTKLVEQMLVSESQKTCNV